LTALPATGILEAFGRPGVEKDRGWPSCLPACRQSSVDPGTRDRRHARCSPGSEHRSAPVSGKPADGATL